MKTILKILTVLIIGLIGLYVLLVVSLNIYSYFEKRNVPEMTPEKAQKLFENAGGINKVNQEAKILLDKWGTNDLKFLYPQDLTNAPAIFSLCSTLQNYSGRNYRTSVAISSRNSRHIEINFGNHFSLKWFYIFDPSTVGPNTNATSSSSSDWFQVSSNIFASK
ncbi:MAG TPA: hypothetical protein VHG71_02955 [Verrucomicrobiae bacterium]|nr:hypothetical protein [Verrucomicrobiae bacterium]